MGACLTRAGFVPPWRIFLAQPRVLVYVCRVTSATFGRLDQTLQENSKRRTRMHKTDPHRSSRPHLSLIGTSSALRGDHGAIQYV